MKKQEMHVPERIMQEEKRMWESDRMVQTEERLCELDVAGHCATCADEALLARVLHIDEQMGSAAVMIADELEEVDITLLDEVAEGDLLLVHGGVAISNTGRDMMADEASNA